MKKFSEFLLSDSTSLKSNVVKEQEEVAPEDSAPEVEKTRGSITIGFGRFNPPTSGHGKLCDAVKNVAGEGEYRIYPSHSCDSKKNPLDCEEKVNWMKASYPDHASNIVYDSKMKTIFDVLQAAHNGGYRSVNLVVGSDRLKEFERLANDYNGQLYSFDKINVISAGDRNPDAEGVEGMSASKLRKAAAEGDFVKFAKGVPNTLGNMEKLELFNVLRRSMNISEETEVWEIAPKLDEEGMRDAYLVDRIYGIGNIVENMNTGLTGEVIRRGTNYVICVTEDGVMFKSWLKDLVENPHEIGTDEYREYVQSLTPGQEVTSYTGVKIASIYDRFRQGKKKNK